ncbi:MAG: hypothetical protein JW969_11815 [Spirochaetales bacterium]|nr:hypothetical protein [Spirochaetales bacterium]
MGNKIIENKPGKNLLENPLIAMILVIALITGLAFLDFLTGYDMGFFIFYFIPIILSAWFLKRSFSILIAVVSSLVWGTVDFVVQHPYSHLLFVFWNAGIRLAAFLLISLFSSRIRELLVKERKLSSELQKALDEIKTLRGFLPICASCKKIKDLSGYWIQIEHYIRDHSEAEFTHTYCPECAKKLYADLKIEDENGTG